MRYCAKALPQPIIFSTAFNSLNLLRIHVFRFQAQFRKPSLLVRQGYYPSLVAVSNELCHYNDFVAVKPLKKRNIVFSADHFSLLCIVVNCSMQRISIHSLPLSIYFCIDGGVQPGYLNLSFSLRLSSLLPQHLTRLRRLYTQPFLLSQLTSPKL